MAEWRRLSRTYCAQCLLWTPLLLSVLIGGCATMDGIIGALRSLQGGKTAVHALSIHADKDLSGGFPLAVDLVIIGDLKAFDSLATLRSSEWFSVRRDMMRQYQARMTLHSWEIVPGQSFSNIEIPKADHEVVAVLLFADYGLGKSYRSDVTGLNRFDLVLGKDDFSVVSKD